MSVLAAGVSLLPAALWAQTTPAPENTEAARVAACRKQADDAFRAKDVETGSQRLRELLEAYPGRWDIARPALEAILRAALRDGPDEWQEYAAVRLIAAYRAGRLLPTDPVLRDAWGTLITLRGSQERYLEAQAELDALGEATGRDIWVEFLEAALHLQADSYEAEPRFAAIMAQLSADDNDPYVRAVWQALYGTEGNRANTNRRFLETATAYQPGRRLPSTAPRNLYLKDFAPNWQAVGALPPETAAPQTHALIADALEPGRFIADDQAATVTWLWTLVDRHLLAAPPAARAPLRQLQESEGPPARAARPLEVFRRLPWSTAGQRALLADARQELALGRADTALRSFREVWAHAEHPALRAEAQVGGWVALAQLDDRDEFEAAFAGVPPDARYPWLGGTETAPRIRERLRANFPAAPAAPPAPGLAQLPRRLVRLPGLAPWPMSLQSHDQGLAWLYGKALMTSLPFARVGLQSHGDGLLVSSPNLLAWYHADDPATALWQRTPRYTFSASRRHPGNYVPPVVGERLYTRWGQLDGCPADVAALDLRTGRQLWSTAQDDTWRNQPRPYRGTRHWPLNDPVYAAGRLYLLAAKIVEADAGSDGIYLMCLDPDRGTRRWACLISDDELVGSRSWSPENAPDLALYGNRVTPHQGAVYCDTSAGIVARVDARDGRLEWAHRYPRTKYTAKDRPRSPGAAGNYPLAWGAPPLVLGNQVICLPRDHHGVFALAADTGELRWQNALVHPAGSIGVCDGALLVYEQRTLVALDLASGATRWFRPLAEDLIGGVTLIGTTLYLGTAGGLARFDARTGRSLERLAWNEPGRQILGYAILDRTLYLISDEAVPTTGFDALVPLQPPASGATASLSLPLQRAWHLARANVQRYVPPPGAGLDGRLFLLSDGVLECILLEPTPAVAWQRLVQPDLAGVRLARGLVVLKYPTRQLFLDGQTGVGQEPQFSPEASGAHELPALYRVTADGNRIEVVNNATGERLWQRGLPALEVGTAAQAGNTLHVVGLRKKGDPRDTLDVVCQLTTGEVQATYSVLSQATAVATRVAFSRKACFVLATQGKEKPAQVLYRYALDGQPAQPVPNCPPFTFSGISTLRVVAETGPYLALQISGPVEGQREPQTAVVILRQDDPAYVFVTGCSGKPEEPGVLPGFIRGDRYYDALPAQGIVRVSDLPRRQTLASGAIPGWDAKYSRFLELLPVGDSLFVLWSLWELHLEAFALDSGARQGSQVLVGVDYTRWPARDREVASLAGRGTWENELAASPGMLWVTDKTGLHALVPSVRLAAPQTPQTLIKLYRRAPLVPDGTLADWNADDGIEIPLRDRDDRPASLRLAQDGQYLYAALAYEDARVDPWRGEGAFYDGDWLAVSQLDGPYRRGLRFGLYPGGTCRLKPEAGSYPIFHRAQGGISHDLRTLRHLYEVALPIERAQPWAQGGLSLQVFDERAGGPARILQCADLRIGYHPLSRQEEGAVLTLVRELPDLPEARARYAKLQQVYRQWGLDLPPAPPTGGPLAPAQVIASINKYLAGLEPDAFPYAFYRRLKGLGGPAALPPAVQDWFQRKERIEAARPGPYPLLDAQYIANWLVLGYFPYPADTYGLGIDFLQNLGGEPRQLPRDDVEIASGTGAKARWHPYVSPGKDVDVFAIKHLGLDLVAEEAYFAVYAACWLKVDQDTECQFQVRTGDENDEARIYLDHEAVGDYSAFQGEGLVSDPQVRLEPGLHLVLLKIAGTKLRPANYRPPLYTFSLRVTDPAGGKLPGLSVWN